MTQLVQGWASLRPSIMNLLPKMFCSYSELAFVVYVLLWWMSSWLHLKTKISIIAYLAPRRLKVVGYLNIFLIPGRLFTLLGPKITFVFLGGCNEKKTPICHLGHDLIEGDNSVSQTLGWLYLHQSFYLLGVGFDSLLCHNKTQEFSKWHTKCIFLGIQLYHVFR